MEFISDYLEDGYPPPAFYFTVMFDTVNARDDIADMAFSEVSGIGTEMELETVAEGGENRFSHQLPKRMKHGNLELKRGVALYISPLVQWCIATLEGEFTQPISPQTVYVLLNGAEDFEVLRAWKFNNAYPVKWSVDGFSSTKNEVAIEHIALAYSYSERVL
jgi:phage tail-like protein